MSQSQTKGSIHWRLQRISSVLLIPLTLWFVSAISGLSSVNYAEALFWMQQPLNALLMISFIFLCCWHLIMGLEIVIEDYISNPGMARTSILMVKLSFGLLTFIGMATIINIATQ